VKTAKRTPRAAPTAPARPQRALRVVPDPEPRAKATGTRGRASVPAWADVLLGTSPGADR
jgi:hypothetical protein